MLSSGVWAVTSRLCEYTAVNLLCNVDEAKWVELESVTGDSCGTIPACSDGQAQAIFNSLQKTCVNASECVFKTNDVKDVSVTDCAATFSYKCIQGVPPKTRVANTTPPAG